MRGRRHDGVMRGDEGERKERHHSPGQGGTSLITKEKFEVKKIFCLKLICGCFKHLFLCFP